MYSDTNKYLDYYIDFQNFRLNKGVKINFMNSKNQFFSAETENIF